MSYTQDEGSMVREPSGQHVKQLTSNVESGEIDSSTNLSIQRDGLFMSTDKTRQPLSDPEVNNEDTLDLGATCTSMQSERQHSPAPSMMSMKSNTSMMEPPTLTGELDASSSMHDRRHYPPSTISMNSAQSMDHFPLLSRSATLGHHNTGPAGVRCNVCQKEAVQSCENCNAHLYRTHALKHSPCPEVRSKFTEVTGDKEQRLSRQMYREQNRLLTLTKKTVDMTFIEELTKKCRRIKSGHPDLYQLDTVREIVNGDSNVRRWTFGQRDNSKKNRTIMLVGETGTGKTTLINSLINYLLGVKKEHNVWFEISEETAGDQTKSQTQFLTVYEVFIETCQNSFSILDTPGFGDTEGGLIGDEMIARKLYSLLSSYDGIYSVDVVGIVLKASLRCMDNKDFYIFNAIQSLFGKNVAENTVLFITHADELFHHNVFAAVEKSKTSVAKNDENQPIHFLFDNFQSDRSQAMQEIIYNAKWDLGQKSTDKLVMCLRNMKTQSLKITENVLRNRLKFEDLVVSINRSTAEIKNKKLELGQIEEVINTMEANRDFKYEVTEKHKVKINIPQTSWFTADEATCCQLCEENCHVGCWGITDLSQCKVFSGGSCTKCTGRCPIDKHVKESKMYELREQTVMKTDLNKKEMYDEKYYKQMCKKQQVQTELNNEKERKSKFLDEAHHHIINLEEIALKQISVLTLVHVDFLIERMKEMETYKAEKLRKLEELMRLDENTQKALKYLRYMKSEQVK